MYKKDYARNFTYYNDDINEYERECLLCDKEDREYERKNDDITMV